MIRSLLIFFLAFSLIPVFTRAQMVDTVVRKGPDTALVGIYINSIHDIDFKLKEFTVSFWLWIKYKKSRDKKNDLDFVNNLEIPHAETSSRSYLNVDSLTSPDSIYILMKMLCEMKDNWSIRNFPFDKQKMNISLENSQFSEDQMVFKIDTLGNHYDSASIYGWNINNIRLSVGHKVYYTNFGDNTVPKPLMKYSTGRVRVNITREPWSLFWKMFLGMYIAFLIAYTCFYIHADGIDSRFGLSVGSLFAVIGNKYIIDSSLPESTSFTLVDSLHGITLFCIFLVISATAYSFRLVKQDKIRQAKRFDMIFAQTLLLLYFIANIYLIYSASHSD